MRKSQVHKTFKVTIQSLFIICAVYLLCSIPATLLYGSLKDANGVSLLQSNIISNLPSSSPWAVFINILMGLSCLCSMPVLLSSTTELLEKNCRPFIAWLNVGPQTTPSFFVTDKQRLSIRFAQIGVLSLIAYVVPDFNSIINLYILLKL